MYILGNLHSHTSYSDGQGTPKEAYAYARDIARLDFIAITEHNHKDAPSRLPANPDLYNGPGPASVITAAKQASRDGKFIGLYGQEFSSIGSGNHANVLEIGELIKASDVPNGEWNKLLDIWLSSHLDSQGKPAILLLNHPAQSSSPNDEEYGIDDYDNLDACRSALDRHVSLINIVNGPSHDDRKPPGRASESEFRRYLNLGLHVAPTADQDNHQKNWGGAANTRTAVIATRLTRAGLLDAMRNRHVYATEDSVKGNQRFVIPAGTVLHPGRSLVVTSGPLATEIPPGRLKWMSSPRWADDGDPGELLDDSGVLRARTEEIDE